MRRRKLAGHNLAIITANLFLDSYLGVFRQRIYVNIVLSFLADETLYIIMFVVNVYYM